MPKKSDKQRGVAVEISQESINKTIRPSGSASVDPTAKENENKKYFLRTLNLQRNQRIELRKNMVIGGSDSDINLSDPSVSSPHCKVVVQKGFLALTDLGSLNGTYVSGQKLKPGRKVILEPNDIVLIGQVEVQMAFSELYEDERPSSDSVGEITKTENTSVEELLAQEESGRPLQFTPASELSKDESESSRVTGTLKSKLSELFKLATPSAQKKNRQEISLELDTKVHSPGTKQSVEDLLKEGQSGNTQTHSTTKDIEGSKLSLNFLKMPFTRRGGGSSSSSATAEKKHPEAPKGKALKPVDLNKKKKQKKTVVAELATFPIRILAAFCDIALIYSVVNLLEEVLPETKPIEALITGMSRDFIKTLEVPELNTAFEWIAPFVFAYCLLHIYFLFSNIVVGVSPGQLFWGIRSEVSSGSKLISGLVKSIINFVLMPFIVFDLTLLMRKKSLKEVLSRSELIRKNTALSVMSGTFFTLFCTAIVLGHSIIYDPDTFMTGIPYRVKKISDKRLGQSRIYSSALNLSFKKSRQFDYLPGFNFVTTAKKTVALPYLIAMKNGKILGKIEVEDKLRAHHFYQIGLKENLIADSHYRNLSRLDANAQLLGPALTSNAVTMRNQLVSEIQKLLEVSLKVNANNLPDIVLEHGPFIKGPIMLRRNIRTLLKYSPGIPMDLNTYSNGTTISTAIEVKRGNKTQRVLALNSPRVRSYLISDYRKKLTVNQFANFIPLLRLGQLDSKDKSEFPPLKSFRRGNKLGGIEVIDFLLADDLTPNEREILVQQVFAFYHRTGGKIVRSSNRQLKSAFLRSVDQIQRLLTLVRWNTKSKGKLKEKLAELKVALKSGKTYFFRKR